jgi:hypothetical protein
VGIATLRQLNPKTLVGNAHPTILITQKIPMFPSPQAHPLERLQVTDGLLLNAERWRLAHEYHRQRQNVHYQSLHQPGIVCGLKVGVVAAPEQFAAQYRDARWLRIQPGVAIDTLGNPIIVPEAIEYRLASEPPKSGTSIIYLVLSYVDPDRLQRSIEPEMVQETFRVDEKTTPPDALEVELCRIVIQSGAVCLEATPDVFSPGVNHVDSRYRQQVQARPLGTVRVEEVGAAGKTQWGDLLRSLPSLYPSLEAEAISAPTDIHDLLSVSSNQLTGLSDAQLENFKRHLASGGTIVVNADEENTHFFKLAMIRQELQLTLAKIRRKMILATEQSELESELAKIETSLAETLAAIAQPVKAFAEQMGIATDQAGKVDRHHPLRNQPFLFAQFPVINAVPTEILVWGGIVLVVGDLDRAWGQDEAMMLPRETIRSAQEMGINILHFAWRRRQY